MNSATKVGEIFNAAGQAFSFLGDLTMQLHPNSESPVGKWSEEDINQLHATVLRFSEDLHKISSSIKNRTVSQIRQTLKKKAFEEAGIPAKQVPVVQPANVISNEQSLLASTKQTVPLQTQSSPSVIAQHIAKSVQIQPPHIISASPLTNIAQELQLLHSQPLQQSLQIHSTQSQETQVPSNTITTSTLHMQQLQQPLSVQQTINNNNAINPTQIIQSSPKQIIIRQQTMPHSATIQLQQGGSLLSSSSQQAQPQVVHLQPHQVHQLQQSHLHLPNSQNPQPSIANPKVPGSPVTLQHFHQMNVQKALLTNVVNTSNAIAISQQQLHSSSIGNQFYSKSKMLPIISSSNNNVVVKPANPLNNAFNKVSVVESAGTVLNSTNLRQDQTKTTAITLPSITTATTTSGTHKTGPDVTMTLNRINTEGNEIDAEECLPAAVAKLDYASEEVAG